MPLGFTGNFFGTSVSSAFVNNNGNITFDSALATFTPFNLTTTGRQIIAPFFGDVDTRGTGSALVNYGQVAVNGRNGFVVNWPGVGFYDSRTSALNNFQLVLIDRSDTGAGNFDIEFNYGQIRWETGEASGGNAQGLGGSSARAGWANGAQATFELPGSGVNGALLDGGPQALVDSTNVGIAGRWVFQVRNGQIIVVPTGAPIASYARAMQGMANRLIGAMQRDLLLRFSGNDGGLDSQLGGADLPDFVAMLGENPMVALLREGMEGGAGGAGNNLDALVQFASSLQAASGGETTLFQAGALRGFLTASYDWGRWNGNSTLGQSRTSYSGAAFSAGIDYQVDPRALFGVALHYGQLRGDLRGPGGRVDLLGFGASAFASFAPMQNAYLDGVVGVTFLEADTRREDLLSTPTGSTTGKQVGATLRGGYNFAAEGVRFGPIGQIRYTRTEFGAFDESGPGAARVGAIDGASLTARVGLRASTAIETEAAIFVPNAMLGYETEFLDGNTTVAVTDLASTATGITRTGDVGRHYMVTELGVSARLRATPAILSLSYSGELFRADSEAHAITLRGRLQF